MDKRRTKECGKQRTEQGGKRPHQATHPEHRRPPLFWNLNMTLSRPACGCQRACRGHRRSAPSGTCPSGLKRAAPSIGQCFATPHHHPGQRHRPLLSLTIQGRQLAVGEVEAARSETIPVTVHQQDSPIALRAPAPAFLRQNKRPRGQGNPGGSGRGSRCS